MVKHFIVLISIAIFTVPVFAKEIGEPVGWHWYNQSLSLKNPRDAARLRAFHHLPPQAQLKLLQAATTRLKDKAILSGKVSDIAAFKRAQDFWVARATQFTLGWEQMLLAHPALNYALTFPHANALAPITQRAKSHEEAQALLQLSKNHGLLFFYRAQEAVDKFSLNIVNRFAHRTHFALIMMAVDNEKTNGLMKANALGVNYFPALVLVNPKTGHTQVVNYGFHSEAELTRRLWQIVHHWQADF